MFIDVSPPLSRRERGEILAACGCGAALAELRARLEVVERRTAQKPLCRKDYAALARILPAIGGVFGSELFLASELTASKAPALTLVLDKRSTRSLGQLFGRADGRAVDGYQIRFADVTEEGAKLWSVYRV